MSDKKSDEKKLMLMRVYHNTVREPQNNDWYHKAYNRFSISKSRTDKLIDDMERLTNTIKPMLN
jgi:hypothetical protein